LRERVKWFWTMEKYIMIDFATNRLVSLLTMGRVKAGNTRLTNYDVRDAKWWQTPQKFEEMRANGVFKQIYSRDKVDKIKGAYARQEAEFADRKAELLSGERLTPLGQINDLRAQFLPRYSAAQCRAIFGSK
jgi:hypothetical protein